jgi:hypothetical protein
MRSASSFIDVNAPIGDEQRDQIRRLDNNALIIRLSFTVNHLSRWLSPIHDPSRLERSMYRGEPSVKDLVIGMRDEEQRVFPKLHLIATQNNPDLDTLPPWRPDPTTIEADRDIPPIVLMAQFRRLRQSTCSLLRSLPDDAWHRRGISRRDYNVTVRELAEHLAEHDYQYLRAMDQTLDQVGAREGLAEIQKVHLDELLKLSPETLTL